MHLRGAIAVRRDDQRHGATASMARNENEDEVARDDRATMTTGVEEDGDEEDDDDEK